MQIISKKIDEVFPYDNNPRRNDEAVPYVAQSIKEFGFKVPLVIDKDGVIVSGHTRLKAAKSLGLKEVPCVVADDLTEEQIKAFRLADNKVGEIATWDFEKLSIELDELEDIEMQDFGFYVAGDDDDFENIFDQQEEKEEEEQEETKEDEDYKVIVKLTTKEEADELMKELLEEGYECEVSQ